VTTIPTIEQKVRGKYPLAFSVNVIVKSFNQSIILAHALCSDHGKKFLIVIVKNQHAFCCDTEDISQQFWIVT
jgi:hypothetical protein